MRVPKNAIVVPLFLIWFVASCAQFQQLTPAGKFHVAKSTAADVIEELTTQARWVVEDRQAGFLEHREAVDRYLALNEAQDALALAVNAATIAFEAGESPLELTEGLLAATDQARRSLRRRTR